MKSSWIKSRSKIYLTTPLYYMNGKPHIGHAYSTLYGDFFKRFQEFFYQKSVILTIGYDQHGKKILDTAIKQKTSVQKFVAQNTKLFDELWNNLGIKYDYKIATTATQHQTFVKQAFDKLLAQKDLYLGNYQAWYCLSCENFINNQNNLLIVKDDKFCNICKSKVKLVTEENYFLKVTDDDRKWLLIQLNKWEQNFWKELTYKVNKSLQTATYQKYVINLLKPLKQWITSGSSLDFALSRTNLAWAIPLNLKNQSAYVWFDALLGYISCLNDQDLQRFFTEPQQQTPNIIYQILGKEITKFHCIYWPLLLKKLNYQIPNGLFIHGWLLNNQIKMSKSLGNVIDPQTLAITINHPRRWEVVRLFLAKLMFPAGDISLSIKDFSNFYQNYLVNNLSNYCFRLLTLIKQFQTNTESNADDISEVKTKEYEQSQTYQNFVQYINQILENYQHNFNHFGFGEGLNNYFQLSDYGNQTLTYLELWKLAKTDAMKFIFWSRQLVNLIYVLAHLMVPFAPKIAQELLNMINQKNFYDFSNSTALTWITLQLPKKPLFFIDKVIKLFQ